MWAAVHAGLAGNADLQSSNLVAHLRISGALQRRASHR